MFFFVFFVFVSIILEPPTLEKISATKTCFFFKPQWTMYPTPAAQAAWGFVAPAGQGMVSSACLIYTVHYQKTRDVHIKSNVVHIKSRTSRQVLSTSSQMLSTSNRAHHVKCCPHQIKCCPRQINQIKCCPHQIKCCPRQINQIKCCQLSTS